MAQRATLDDRSLCSLCGARVSAVSAACGECGSQFEGDFAALTCPFCGSVTPAGPACAMCGSEMPKPERSPLPDSWTAGDVEKVPKKNERTGKTKESPVPSPPVEVVRPPTEAQPAPATPAPKPTPPPQAQIPKPPSPAGAKPTSRQPAPSTSAPPVIAKTSRPGVVPPSPQIPEPSKSSFARADPTMMDIEAAQLDGKLVGLMLKVNSFAGRRDLMSLRETAVAIVIALENAGIRPTTDENEPLVARTRVQEVGRRLRDADARQRELEQKIAGLELEKIGLENRMAEERKRRTADDILSGDEYQEEGLAVVLKRVRLNLIPLQKSLEEADDEGRKKALKILEKLNEQLNEVVGEGG